MNRLLAVWVMLVSAFFTTSASAQSVLYSAFDKYDAHNGDYAVVGRVANKNYAYLMTTDGALLNAYDDSMNKTATVLLDFLPEVLYEVKFITYADKIIILYQSLEGNKVVQYAALLDEKGRLKSKPQMLGSSKTGLLGATKTYYAYAISENKKNIVIYSARDKNGNIEFDAKWLDDNLVISKRSHVEISTDNPVRHGEVNVDNSGNVYMAMYTEVGSLNYADQYWIMTLPPGGNRFDGKELKLDQKFAANGYMKIDNLNGKVYFGGFYSNRKNGSFDGVIYAAYDMTLGSYSVQKYIPFDKSLVENADKRRRNHAFDNYEVKQIIPRGDGGFVLISEIHYVTLRSNYVPGGIGYGPFFNSGTSTVTHEYHYNDIMALSYNKDGVRQWDAYIPKEQFSTEDNGVYSSYALLNSGGTLAFLFNDFNMRGNGLQLATLSSDGKTDIHTFAPDGNDNPLWVPRQGKQIAARDILVPCFRKKEICFAIVLF